MVNGPACSLAWTLAGILSAAPLAAVRVEVVAPGGVPAAGATVRGFVQPVTPALIESRRSAIATGITDQAGAVELGLPALPRVLLVVDAPGRAPRIVTAAPGPRLRIAVEAGESLSGKAQGEGGLSGKACVHWQRTLEPLGRTLEFERCAALAAGGAFRITGLDSGAAGRLRISAEGYLPIDVPWPAAKSDAYRLSRGTVLRGLVLGPGERPVPGARVKLAGGDEATSDSAGKFEVRTASLPARLTVQAPGFRRREEAVREAVPLRLVLTPGATLQARVLDGVGKPVEKVSLLVRRQLPGGAWARDETLAPAPKGDLLLDLAPPGLYRFEVRAEGLRPFASEPFAVTATQGANLGVVLLSTGAGVEGTVAHALEGRPLSGVLVTLWPQGLAGLQRAVTSSIAQAVTDSEGRFRIAGRAEGAYEVRFERSGYAPAYREVHLLDDGVLPVGSVSLDPGIAVHGRVRNRAGKAKPGVHVLFLAESGGSRLPLAEATTGDDGAFSGISLSPGPYRVEVRSDRTLLAQTVTLSASDSERKLDLRTNETAAAGIVLRHGQPVPGGWLTAEIASLATPRGGQLILRTPDGGQEILGAPASPSFQAEVGADGSFTFDDVPAGRLLLTYQAPEGDSLRKLVDLPAAGASDLTIDFSGASLRGLARLRDTGEPLADVSVEVRDAQGNPLGAALSDAAGRFAFEDIGATDLLVEASKPGYRGQASRISLQGKATESVALDLDPAESGVLTVRLQGENGQPLAFAFATLLTEGGSLVRSLPLDALGTRRFEDLPDGTYRVAWSDPAFGLGVSAPVTVRNHEEQRVEQQLRTPAHLSLVCSAESCRRGLLEGLTLLAAPGLDLASLLPGFSPGLAISADGRLPLGALQPGEYRLAVRLEGSASFFTLQVTPGQILEVPVGPRPPSPEARVVAARP
ncbi:MAG: carboxypeptidase regulatory-like domain-containing protein [Thermoanaerobaculia bacterium]